MSPRHTHIAPRKAETRGPRSHNVDSGLVALLASRVLNVRLYVLGTCGADVEWLELSNSGRPLSSRVERRYQVTLTEVRKGSTHFVQSLKGAGDIRLHLEQMGFVPGSRVTVVSSLGGALIVNIKGSRVALAKELASSVIV